MRPVLDFQGMRVFEQHFLSQGLPGLVLMENAGRGAAHLLGLKLSPRAQDAAKSSQLRGSCVRCADERALQHTDVCVVAGPGNNGGDGFVVARHLASRGARVKVLSARPVEQLQGDARLAAQAWLAVGGALLPLTPEAVEEDRSSLLVDALLGTGLHSVPEGEMAAIVAAMNRHTGAKFALDVPSGLGEGLPKTQVFEAEHTICFGHLKTVLLEPSSQRFCGRITVSHLGVPSTLPTDLWPRAELMEREDLAPRLAPRDPSVHKHRVGQVHVLGGSQDSPGAALLAARAALRAGAGLSTLLLGPELASMSRVELDELLCAHYESAVDLGELVRKAEVLVVGPGLPQKEQAREEVEFLLDSLSPGNLVVLDATALRFFGERAAGLRVLVEGGVHLVLTPHPGEMAELLGLSTAAVEANRLEAAEELAEQTLATVVLKGSRSVIAHSGQTTRICGLGSPALATAGSGDVLAGVLAGLWASSSLKLSEGQIPSFELATLAVGLHALAGELWEAEHGDAGLLASELGSWVARARAKVLQA